MKKMLIESRTETLKKQLEKLLDSEFITFDDLKIIDSSGVYVIHHRDTPIYVGKTIRQGKKRLREMVSDYRSHTLNRKIMLELLNKKFKLSLKSLGNKHKEKLIRDGKITREQFKKLQREVNNSIKTEFKIKFIPITSEKYLSSFEHFAIGCLSPKYND